MKPFWRVNLLGALVYLLLVGWLLIASTLRVFMDLSAGIDNPMPFIGLTMGAIGLIGIGFGHSFERDDHD